ncbi:MAG: sugar kinase [Mastigocoleus sp. MO_167.B18]|nr:sugar kinase [Mastigocoleus sp. MO_167.B18]
MKKHGLFVGLVTLDLIYLAESPPNHNQKIVAADYTVATGGPATNAAVTFNHLGDRGTIVGVIGSHPMSQLVRTDLEDYKVTVTDLAPDNNNSLPVSSIIVTEATGERAVISINAVKTQINAQNIPDNILDNVDIVLIDGHQMIVGLHIAQMAKAKNIPVVIDGGSWKAGFEQILPEVDYAICSSNFYPPNCPDIPKEDTKSRFQAVSSYIQALNVPNIAITQGEEPIYYFSQGETGTIEVAKIEAVDTLGAGDIFHGAFCHFILRKNFTEALTSAANVASHSCKFFGTRLWMKSSK